MDRIQDFFTIYKQSALDKDTDGMIKLYDENVVIFDMWTHGFQTGLTEWSSAIIDWLGSLGEEKVNVIFEMIDIKESDQVGFASALVTYQAITTEDTVIRSMKNRVTLGFIKTQDVWKVVHQHTSAPINFELEAILTF
jgi:ketosteroid isomerase-like protein